MEFTIENLERAVTHFYQDLATQSQLNLWLTAAQSSAEAWTFCWQLLDQTKVMPVLMEFAVSFNYYEFIADTDTILWGKLFTNKVVKVLA